jgi:hypothetical protein
MADYKGIKGFSIPTVSSDPSDPILGQIWYNSTSGTLKGEVAGVGTWASGGDLNTGRGQMGSASLASLSTGFGFGGWDAIPGGSRRDLAEQYNGTCWTEGPDMPGTAAQAGSYGINTSALSASGRNQGGSLNSGSFEWDGSSWSDGGTMNDARRNLTGAGSSVPAGLAIGGGDNPGPAQDLAESYDGTTWTEITAFNTARHGGTGAGTQTAALYMGGNPPYYKVVEEWNGSSWTEITGMNNDRASAGGRAGTVNDALSFSMATPGASVINEKWNGTSWTDLNDLSVVRYNMTGGGPSTSNALCYGGYGAAPANQSTEEWTVPETTTVTVTTS